MGTLTRKIEPPAIAGGTDLISARSTRKVQPAAIAGVTGLRRAVSLTLAVSVMLSLLLLTPAESFAAIKVDKRQRYAAKPQLTRAEVKGAEARLAEMGYGTGQVDGVIDGDTRNALIAFQKWEGLKVTGRISRADFDAIMNAAAPQARDTGYRHVEIDLDRQVLLLTDADGVVERVLPISSGSNKQYREKGGRGLAYTPRGRFRINAKISGWRKSPLGLLYYPSYFSGGVAIHGNPSVPHQPESHGCVRIPMSAAVEVYRQLPVGTIVLIYDKHSFVSARDWVEEGSRQSAGAEGSRQSAAGPD